MFAKMFNSGKIKEVGNLICVKHLTNFMSGRDPHVSQRQSRCADFAAAFRLHPSNAHFAQGEAFKFDPHV